MTQTSAGIDCTVEPWPLRVSFRYAHDTITAVDIVRLRITSPGGEELGLGEIAADSGYGQDSAAIATQAAELAARVATVRDADPSTLKAALTEVEDTVSGPARMLVEMAVLDAAARRAGVAVWQLLGLPAPSRVQLMYTVSFGEPVPTDIRPVKVKLGGPEDETVLRQLIGAPGPILLDVNRGWNAARWRQLRDLVQRVAPVLLEDPVDDLALLPEIRAALPSTAVVLDEPVNSRADAEHAALIADGANLKPTRVGGLLATMDALAHLTARGATRMLGCFLEPPRTIAYLAQLAPLCDWTDLDGHFWLTDDPVTMSYTLTSTTPGIPRIAY